MNNAADIAERLRDGLRRLAKAVVVVTAQHEAQRYAMAATAVSELSLDPPSLLVCVNRNAGLYAPLAAGAGFCLNILHASQASIAAACGGQMAREQRFELGVWAASKSGLPFLQGAQANFMCRNDCSMEYGTHAIFIGIVEEVLTSGGVDPLLYVGGRYTRAAD